MRPIDPRLLRRARPAATHLVTCVVLGVLTAGLVLGQAHTLARLVAGAATGDLAPGETTDLLVVLALVLAARALLPWGQEVAGRRAATAVKAVLRSQLAAHALRLGPAWLAGQPSGRLVGLVGTGLDALDDYVARYLPQLVLATLVPVVVLVQVVVADPVSAVTIGATLPLVPVFMVLVGLATAQRSRRRWRALTVLSQHFADVVAGLATLKLFGRARAQAVEVERVTAAHRRESMAALRVAFLSALVLELLASLAVALVAVGIGLRLVHGDLDLQTGLLVLLLAPEAYLPLRQVGTLFHTSADGLAAAEDAFAVLETEPTVVGGATTPPDLTRAVLRVEGLVVEHPGRGRPALERVTLELHPGEVVALTGPSGCGKSTLLAVLLGFVAPTAGRVVVGTDDLAELDLAAWRQQVAWLPQRPALLPGTVADNVRLGRPDADVLDVRAALDAAGATDLGLDTEVGERGGRLSAGQQRRVGLARALVRGAPLLLLDEPTAGLDVETEAGVIAGLLADRTRTVLLVAHRPSLLAAADRVVDLGAHAMPGGGTW